MTDHPNLKILLFTGQAGSGKSTAVQYLAKQGFPKVSVHDTDDKTATGKVIDQVQHLANAGQHRIVIDDVQSIDEYHALKHAFPGELTTVAVARSKNETAPDGSPDSIADRIINNDGSIDEFHQALKSLIQDLEF